MTADLDDLRAKLAAWFLAQAMDRQGLTPEDDADGLIAVPLAPLIAKAESADRLMADYERGLEHRNDLMDRVVMLKTEVAAATARADRLAAEVEALRAALKPFADAFTGDAKDWPDGTVLCRRITFGHLRAARAALAAEKGDKPEGSRHAD